MVTKDSLIIAFSTLLAVAATAVGAITIAPFSIDGGGGMRSTGGGFELSGTIGQADAGVLSGGDFILTGGFWFETPPGDCDSDGAAGLPDVAAFEDCMTGPDGALLPPCQCFDLDGSEAIDLIDFAILQSAFISF